MRGVVAMGVLLSLVGRAAADEPVVRHEGRVSISRAINRDGTAAFASAQAEFRNSPVWGAVIGRDGPCVFHEPLPTRSVSAGLITVSGSFPPITLEETPVSRGVGYRNRAVPNYYAEGSTITVEGPGGAEIPAFVATVKAPQELAGYVPPTSLSRADGYTAHWTAAPGSEMLIVIVAVNRQRQSIAVVCRVPDTGSFTVPPSTFNQIPQSLDQALVTVARISESVQVVGDTRIFVDVLSTRMSGPFDLDVVAPPKSRDTTPWVYLTLGFGYTSEAPSWRVQLGQRLAHGVHLVEELDSLGYAVVSDTFFEDRFSFGLGVRWTPFEPRPRRSPFPLVPFVDTHALYLTAVVGAAFRDRSTEPMTSDTEWSPMASLAVGLLQIQGHDWALGPEIRWQLTRFDGKVERDAQALFAVHLNQW